MNAKSIIESLLFVYGEPISLKKIGKILGLSQEAVIKNFKELNEDYQKEERGLRIIEKGDEIQLVTAPENSSYVQKLIQTDIRQELSPAALETLAIIAYRGPISRAEINDVRGVDSSFLLRRLLLRGLIERVEYPKDRRIYLYKITFEFLKLLGVNKLENLPNYEELRKK